MKNWVCMLFIFVAVSSANVSGEKENASESVSTFIGTAAGGNTFPGASLPFGMMQWSPDTRSDGWYHFSDATIRGFSLTHISGAGCPIYADVPILPWIGNPGEDPKSASLRFSHDHERAQPGYYSVKFDNGVQADLTVTARAGIGRFTFPAGATRTMLFNAGGSGNARDKLRSGDSSTINVTGNDTLVGTVHSGGFCSVPSDYVLYFAVRFELPFSSFGTWASQIQPGSRAASGHQAGAYVTFLSGAAPVVLKVGISFVSTENAVANMAAEIPDWDFDRVHAAANSTWSELLKRIQVEGGAPEDHVIFDTALYHMLLSPNLFSDANGDYIGFDGKIRRLRPAEEQYANFSDWDIYRNLVQLQALLVPGRVSRMMQSLVRDAEQSGWLPKWPVANDVSYVMGGDSPPIVISDAWSFGARSFDTGTALKYMIKGASVPGQDLHGGSERPWLADYMQKGYVPVARQGQEIGASITLEYASSDFAISQFARAMGDQAHADALLESSQNWKKLFDAESGFIRPRDASGRFLEDWDPNQPQPKPQGRWSAEQLGFEEGNAWNYTFMIPHNYRGLLQAMGGPANALPKLDKFFRNLSGMGSANFTVENEPDFCTPYVYMWTGYPWKTQEVIDRIRRETFSTKPDGLPGNDDLGATSGVYVWNALGMYPVIPGVGGLVLGTPLFPRTALHLGNGRVLEITSSGEGVYVQSVKVNAKPYASSWLPLEKLTAGRNRIEFVLGKRPGSWATQPTSFPPSFEGQDQ